MKLLAVLLLSGGALLAASLPLLRHGEAAVSAEAFVESVGVSVHLHYTDTPYSNFAAVESALKALGIRHIRDVTGDVAVFGCRSRSRWSARNKAGCLKGCRGFRFEEVVFGLFR